MSGSSTAVQQPFIGQNGLIFATVFQALTWLNTLLASNRSTIGTIANPVNLVYNLLLNAITSVNANMTAGALAAEVQSMIALQALPISLDESTTSFFNARIAAITAASEQVAALQPAANPFTVVSSLTAGVSGLLDSGYLNYCLAFNSEAPPAGLTATNLPAMAEAAATAWFNVAGAVAAVQGTALTQAYDTATRQYRCAAVVANVIKQLQSGPFTTMTGNQNSLWNSVVALPTILLDGESLATSPSSLAAQQGLVIRFALSQVANQLALLLYAINTAVGGIPVTAILNNQDTLLDLAARELGNFEDWSQIANINALSPPYPGPTNTTAALSGKQLFMPGSNIQIGSNITPPTYPDSVMGVDYYFGPINGPQPAWTGNLAILTGFLNFAAALGRRIQTPLGALVYHSNYGSRLPGEIGAIQSTDESAKLEAFASAAINADKRTGSILSISSAVQPGTMLANITALVQPVGPSSTPVALDTPVSALTGT
jgi:hypothetical protein